MGAPEVTRFLTWLAVDRSVAASTPRLMAILMYGAGLRLLECARLRVKDVGFPYALVRKYPRAGQEWAWQ